MIHLSYPQGVTIDTSDDNARPLPTLEPEPLDAYEADPIVFAYGDILDPVVGPLTGVEVGAVGGDVLARAGIDTAGRPVSGTMRLHVEIGQDGTSLVVGWHVDVDETPTG